MTATTERQLLSVEETHEQLVDLVYDLIANYPDTSALPLIDIKQRIDNWFHTIVCLDQAMSA